MKKIVITFFICILSFSCAVMMVVYCMNLSDQYMDDKKYMYVDTGHSMYNKLQDEDYVKGTYIIEQDQVVKLRNINKQVRASVITVDFALNNMFGVTGNLLEYDSVGCIISDVLAENLFGSYDVIGCIIKVGDKEYVIRSLIDSDEMFIITEEEQNANTNLYVESKKINGAIIDISEEAYRGQYLQEFCTRHNVDGNDNYYVSDYLNIFPTIEFPTKWSDLTRWSTIIKQWNKIAEKRLYKNKDFIEIYYYNLWMKMNKYKKCIFIVSILFIASFIQYISLVRKRKR